MQAHSEVPWIKNKKLDDINWDAILAKKSEDGIYDNICTVITKVPLKFVPKRIMGRKKGIPHERRAYFKKIRVLRRNLNNWYFSRDTPVVNNKIK